MEVKTAELCRILGVNRQRVYQYTQRGMPKLRWGWFDSEACLAWVAENVQTENRPPPRPAEEQAEIEDLAEAQQEYIEAGQATISAVRLRLLTAQSQNQELKNQYFSNLLVSRDAVITAIRGRDRELITQLEQWVTRETDGARRSLRREIVEDLRRTILATIDSVGADLASREHMATTAVRQPRYLGRV